MNIIRACWVGIFPSLFFIIPTLFCQQLAAVLFSHTKSAPATSQLAIFFFHSKSAPPATRHSQPNRVIANEISFVPIHMLVCCTSIGHVYSSEPKCMRLCTGHKSANEISYQTSIKIQARASDWTQIKRERKINHTVSRKGKTALRICKFESFHHVSQSM